jgi:hypothetical protein
MGNDLDERRVTKAIKRALVLIAEQDPVTCAVAE